MDCLPARRLQGQFLTCDTGVTNLINLALRSKRPLAPRFGFCSSVASALSWSGKDPIPERMLHDPRVATGLGYSKSKWVAEQICDRANISADSRRLNGRVMVFRVGQLSGDSVRGVWNASEAWPMMLSTAKVIGALPDLGEQEKLDWLPVDVAAQAIVQGVGASRSRLAKLWRLEGDSSSSTDEQGGGGEQSDCKEGPSVSGVETAMGGKEKMASEAPQRRTPTMHVVNDGDNPNWREMLGWLAGEVDFEVVSPAKWVSLLEALSEGGSQPEHPALRLLGMWKASYEGPPRSEEEVEEARKTFSVGKTKAAIEVLRHVEPLDQAYVARLWRWISETM